MLVIDWNDYNFLLFDHVFIIFIREDFLEYAMATFIK